MTDTYPEFIVNGFIRSGILGTLSGKEEGDEVDDDSDYDLDSELEDESSSDEDESSDGVNLVISDLLTCTVTSPPPLYIIEIVL